MVEKRKEQMKRMHQRRAEMQILRELKKPVDDLQLKDLEVRLFDTWWID